MRAELATQGLFVFMDWSDRAALCSLRTWFTKARERDVPSVASMSFLQAEQNFW